MGEVSECASWSMVTRSECKDDEEDPHESEWVCKEVGVRRWVSVDMGISVTGG